MNRTLLAEHGDFRVESCPCGTINIHLGQVSLRVSPMTLLTISDVLGGARDNYLDLIAHLQSEHLNETSKTFLTKSSNDQKH